MEKNTGRSGITMIDDGQDRKEQVAGLYSRVAATYGRIGPDLFTPFGSFLVAQTQLSPGEQILDVATGRGAALLAAAEQVGPAGFVFGIDFAAPMIQQTAAELREKGITNAAVQQMDAEHLAFANASFDAVLCSFALWFFPHVEQAVAEFQRVLRPNGKLGICLPAGADERWLWYTQLVFAYHQKYHLTTAWVPRIFGPADVTCLLSQAGFVALSTAWQDYDFVYGTEQEWWEAQWTDAARFPLESMPPAVLEEFKTEVFQHMATMKQSDGLHYQRKAYCVVGTKSPLDEE